MIAGSIFSPLTISDPHWEHMGTTEKTKLSLIQPWQLSPVQVHTAVNSLGRSSSILFRELYIGASLFSP